MTLTASERAKIEQKLGRHLTPTDEAQIENELGTRLRDLFSGFPGAEQPAQPPPQPPGAPPPPMTVISPLQKEMGYLQAGAPPPPSQLQGSPYMTSDPIKEQELPDVGAQFNINPQAWDAMVANWPEGSGGIENRMQEPMAPIPSRQNPYGTDPNSGWGKGFGTSGYNNPPGSLVPQ